MLRTDQNAVIQDKLKKVTGLRDRMFLNITIASEIYHSAHVKQVFFHFIEFSQRCEIDLNLFSLRPILGEIWVYVRDHLLLYVYLYLRYHCADYVLIYK